MNNRPPKPAKGTATRRAALRLLDAVLRQGLPLDTAAPKILAPLDRADDRGLALAIAGEVLRRMPDYDALIDSATKKRLPDDAKARTVLRMALAQALALETPPHAAISTALPLLDGGPRRLAHGVFGTLMRQEAKLPEIPTLPDEVTARWRGQWGDAVTEAAARAIATPPPLDLSFADPAKAERFTAEHNGKALASGHVRLPRQPIDTLEGFEAGNWWVQDIAASLPARLLGNGEGRAALDLCAAPGGKTMQMAAAGWQVTALDRSEKRLERLADNLARTGLQAETIAADALAWKPERAFDAILLDAPCSATGIFRRHPEILYRARPKAIAESANVQAKLLRRAANWVKPGGELVYAVCSLERSEGEEIIDAFLTEHDGFSIIPPDPAMLPDGLAAGERGWLRILPGQIDDPGGCDGFFMAKLRRE